MSKSLSKILPQSYILAAVFLYTIHMTSIAKHFKQFVTKNISKKLISAKSEIQEKRITSFVKGVNNANKKIES